VLAHVTPSTMKKFELPCTKSSCKSQNCMSRSKSKLSSFCCILHACLVACCMHDMHVMCMLSSSHACTAKVESIVELAYHAVPCQGRVVTKV
jgi:hypothetical protein